MSDEDIKRMIGESYDLTGDCSKRDKSPCGTAASGMVFNPKGEQNNTGQGNKDEQTE